MPVGKQRQLLRDFFGLAGRVWFDKVSLDRWSKLFNRRHKNFKIMSLTFGPAKSLEEINLDDVLKYPIWLWVWETGHEDDPGVDETWQQPVTSTTDVTNEMISPNITLRIKGSDLYASGEYDPERDGLRAISIWDG